MRRLMDGMTSKIAQRDQSYKKKLSSVPIAGDIEMFG
jgi:hypothetical protein